MEDSKLKQDQEVIIASSASRLIELLESNYERKSIKIGFGMHTGLMLFEALEINPKYVNHCRAKYKASKRIQRRNREAWEKEIYE